jgi:hypothetical protein
VTDRVLITSEDHDQMFGLKEPVNAAKAIQETVTGKPIMQFALDERSGDLSLVFEDGGTMQFLTTSDGYEGWRTAHGDQLVICLGGGELAIFDRK